MAWRRFRYDIVDSTNECAFEAIERGEARHGDLFIARSQTAGRGTHGRAWESAPGGLYASAVLIGEALPPPGAWTIAGALAVHDVVVDAGIDASIDWPNDVVGPGGAKIAGVLAESRGLRAVGPAVFVLGVGLNVDGSALSDDLRSERRVSSLREHGADVDVERAEDALAAALERRVEEAERDPRATFTAFFERSALANQRVVVVGAERDVEGVWTALDPSLGLRVEAAGEPTRYVSVAHARSVRPLERGGER